MAPTSFGSADEGRAIARDASGNVYVTGHFSGTADFDPGAGTANLSSAGGSNDIFIAKYDASGNYVWAKRVGGTSNEIGYDLAVDGSRNVHVTGSLVGTNVDCTFISGDIEWHNGMPSGAGVNNATVNLTGAATGSDVTDMNGDYAITAGVTGNFTITPVKNVNKLNGITVADAATIQQHIAGITPITNPYRQVAADVNKSNSITAFDATIINQALLGNPSAPAQFKTSWRFVPKSHTMVLPPWGFPEKIDLLSVSRNKTDQDFYGIKTGDLVTAFANPASLMPQPPLVLRAQDRTLEAGEELTVEFSADQFDDLAAWQFALQFDPIRLQIIEIQLLETLSLTTDHFGAFNISEGEIRLVWSQAAGVSVAEGTGTGPNSGMSEYRLLQNTPNPFVDKTTVGFILPETCEAQLRVFDVSGRLLAERKGLYPAGRNEEILEVNGATGVLYYELTTPFGVLARKMVALKN